MQLFDYDCNTIIFVHHKMSFPTFSQKPKKQKKTKKKEQKAKKKKKERVPQHQMTKIPFQHMREQYAHFAKPAVWKELKCAASYPTLRCLYK